jgi:hypothetical protein
MSNCQMSHLREPISKGFSSKGEREMKERR